MPEDLLAQLVLQVQPVQQVLRGLQDHRELLDHKESPASPVRLVHLKDPLE